MQERLQVCWQNDISKMHRASVACVGIAATPALVCISDIDQETE
jgi:hypothetical protein